MGFCYFSIILVINLHYFGAQIIPDLASVNPLKLEAWILSQLRWTGRVRFACFRLCVNALCGEQRMKQGDLTGGSCVVQVGDAS